MQVLSFKMKLYLVMWLVVQLLRLCEGKNRWLSLFSDKGKDKKFSERQQYQDNQAAMNSQGRKIRLEELSYC